MTAKQRQVKEALALVFGRALREKRLDKGLTQRQLADLAGVSVYHLSRIECGVANPRLATVGALFGALGWHVGIGLGLGRPR